MTYRLDDLGWLQFELLAQALMKAWLGPGVESWGGSSDLGRDCYCPSPLSYPGTEKNDGPFVFQAKFVAGANAAGAKADGSLLKAAAAESSRILARIESGVWEEPTFYILITNCPVNSGVRKKVEKSIGKACPETKVSVLGGRDVNALLARHPEIRRSFPQLLGLADLSLLLSQQVNHDLLERSAAATALAKGLEKVFVPTGAFEKARAILIQHHFVVLEGPPEMGKTAIARVLGLIRLLDQREIYECKTPDDFFKAYNKNQKQFFIADDAFGRTEFDPTLGKLWEQDLEKVLLRLDNSHELCWTSRKHILERALRKMDLQGEASKLPKPNAVLVDASKLELRDKTLMLLRHAKAAALSLPKIKLIRKLGRQIVQDPHFTPERIRRFVANVPDSGGSANEKEGIIAQVKQAIADPTISMRKSFAALSSAHRLLLYCMLERHWWDDIETLEVAFTQAHSAFSISEKFSDVVEELVGSFLRELELQNSKERHVDWVHPSVRDLVIEHLMMSPLDRERFLSRGGVPCFVLALSGVGGTAGTRLRPLLRTEGDWNLLQVLVSRVIANVSTDSGELKSMVDTALEADTDSFDSKERSSFEEVIDGLFESVRLRLAESLLLLDVDLYRSLCELSVKTFPMKSLPLPAELWKALCKRAFDGVAAKHPYSVALDIPPFLKLLALLNQYEPRFLLAIRYPEVMEDELTAAFGRLADFEVGENECSFQDEKDALADVALALQRLSDVYAPGAEWDDIRAALKRKIQECEEHISEDEYSSDEVDPDIGSRDQSVFTADMIDSVLADLEG